MCDLWCILSIIAYIFLIFILLFILIVQIILRIIRKWIHQFPIPAFATRLIDNPFRRKIQNPKKIAERMHLEPGMQVLEVGPGKGSYTKAVAKKILPEGKVYSIDIQEKVIETLKKRLKKEAIDNIIPKVDDAYNLSFDDESIDRIFSIACLPEIPDPVRVLKEFKRVLKPDGIITLSELLMDPDYPRRKTEKKWAAEAGLKFIEGFGNVFVYQLNFGKK